MSSKKKAEPPPPGHELGADDYLAAAQDHARALASTYANGDHALTMATTLNDKLRRALAARFPGADLKLTRSGHGKRLGGTLVWSGFEDTAQIDRQVELRRAIDDALSDEEQLLVSFILTVTPDELESITNDA